MSRVKNAFHDEICLRGMSVGERADAAFYAVREVISRAILTLAPLPWETTDEANAACDHIATAAIEAYCGASGAEGAA